MVDDTQNQSAPEAPTPPRNARSTQPVSADAAATPTVTAAASDVSAEAVPGPTPEPEVATDAPLTAAQVAELSNNGRAVPDGWAYSAQLGWHQVTVERGRTGASPLIVTPVDAAE